MSGKSQGISLIPTGGNPVKCRQSNSFGKYMDIWIRAFPFSLIIFIALL